jgi:hypothetical protein
MKLVDCKVILTASYINSHKKIDNLFPATIIGVMVRERSTQTDPDSMVERPGQSPIKRSALVAHQRVIEGRKKRAKGDLGVKLLGYPVDVCADRGNILFEKADKF